MTRFNTTFDGGRVCSTPTYITTPPHRSVVVRCSRAHHAPPLSAGLRHGVVAVRSGLAR
jgi:hypothetical protein